MSQSASMPHPLAAPHACAQERLHASTPGRWYAGGQRPLINAEV